MHPRPAPPPAALILGCGYLGQRLAARLLDTGTRVYGSVRTTAPAERLFEMGVRPMLVHITQPLSYVALKPALDEPLLDVYLMVPPGRSGRSPTPRQVLLGGTAHVLKQLRRVHAEGRLHRAILVTSTAVYGDRGGTTITAESPVHPDQLTGTAYLMLGAERLWLEGGRSVPRAPTRRSLRPIPHPRPQGGPRRCPPSWATPQAPPQPHPCRRRSLAFTSHRCIRNRRPASSSAATATHPPDSTTTPTSPTSWASLPQPPSPPAEAARQFPSLDAARLRAPASKRCDPRPTTARTGWSPRFSNYLAGLADALQPGG